jgi:hypothetical protein
MGVRADGARLGALQQKPEDAGGLEARGWCEIGGAATKTRRCRRTGGLGDRVEAKKIKTNAVVLEGARRPSTRFRVQCLFQSNGSVNLMIVTQDGDVLSQSGVRGDRVGFTDVGF